MMPATFLLLLAVVALVTATGWIAHPVFRWLGNRLPWRRPPSWVAGSSLPTAPPLAIDPYRAAYEIALREWGTKIVNTGEEVAYGWYELLFQIDPPVAGVFEVKTVMGGALFTPGLRCMVIVDREQITVLDREHNHGVRLTARWPQQRVHAVLDGSVLLLHVVIDEHVCDGGGSRSDTDASGRISEKLFSVNLCVAHASCLVPADWPGTAVLLPQPAVGASATETC